MNSKYLVNGQDKLKKKLHDGDKTKQLNIKNTQETYWGTQ